MRAALSQCGYLSSKTRQLFYAPNMTVHQATGDPPATKDFGWGAIHQACRSIVALVDGLAFKSIPPIVGKILGFKVIHRKQGLSTQTIDVPILSAKSPDS